MPSSLSASTRGLSFEDRRERSLEPTPSSSARERERAIERERNDLREQLRRRDSRIRELQSELSRAKTTASSGVSRISASNVAKLEDEIRTLRRKLKDAEISTTHARREAQQSRYVYC